MLDLSKVFEAMRSGDGSTNANGSTNPGPMNTEYGTIAGSFVYKILSNWYMLAAIPAMVVTYNVLKALSDSGILDKVYLEVQKAMNLLIKYSVDCPAKISDIEQFMKCLSS